MYYAVKTVNVNPWKPVNQYGHIEQVYPVDKIHDDLNARIVALNDNNMTFIHISLDSLGTPYSLQEKLENNLSIEGQFCLVISATHTHYAADPRNEDYYNQLYKQLKEGVETLDYQECTSISTSYEVLPFNEVGVSRITGHQANVLLGLLTIYADDKPIVRYIYHNVHPTVLAAKDTDYFSAEWPGYVISELNKNGCFHSYIQGPAGDISTRFTRRDQSYESVMELGNKLVVKMEEMEKKEYEKHPLQLSVKKDVIKCHHEFDPVSLDDLPDNISEREIETINTGVIMRNHLKEHPELLTKEIHLTKVSLGSYTLIFEPNELFSGYLDYIDTTKELLACYSNGYEPYVTPLGQKLFTYETFTDTLTVETKQELIEKLKSNN